MNFRALDPSRVEGYTMPIEHISAVTFAVHDMACSVGFYKKLGAAPKDEWDLYQLTGVALEALAG